jgi:hypothetical protein
MSFLLSLMSSLQQNWKRGQNRFCLEVRGQEGDRAQTLYAHMNKWIKKIITWQIGYLEACRLMLKCLNIFLLSFCYWFLVQVHAVVKTYSMISMLSNLLICFIGQDIVCFVIYSRMLENNTNLWLFSGLFYKYLLCWKKINSFLHLLQDPIHPNKPLSWSLIGISFVMVTVIIMWPHLTIIW